MNCHSTPLYSHLHIPIQQVEISASTKSAETIKNTMDTLTGVTTPVIQRMKLLVNAWTLDCSPKCRSSLMIECESDAFHKNPMKFMKQTYLISPSAPITEEDDDTFNDKK